MGCRIIFLVNMVYQIVYFLINFLFPIGYRGSSILRQLTIVEHVMWKVLWLQGETYGDLKHPTIVPLLGTAIHLSSLSSLGQYFLFVMQLFFYLCIYQSNTYFGTATIGRSALFFPLVLS